MGRIKLLVLDVDGTLTDGGIYISESGEQSKKFNVKDGMGIVQVQKAGIAVGIISHSNSSGMVEKRASMLKIKHVYVGKQSKLEVLEDWAAKLELSLSEVAYIGDDLNDLEAMEAVGVSACPADAAQLVREKADHVLTKDGGKGAVREFIDLHLL